MTTGRVRPARRPAALLAAAMAMLAAGVAPPLVPAAAAQAESRDVQRVKGSDRWRTDFSQASVPLSEILSGGPPKDGIPSIDRPKFESAGDADWLGERDPVLVVEHGGEVKAYPLGILVWHEIVNDEVGGLPVAVTFCPLCNTSIVFEREVDGRVLDFGTTGRLRHSDLVMYDRQTETWWQQAIGEAIVGELTGTRLTLVPANTLGWERARELYPDIRVLSRDTGFESYRRAGRYGRNPYERYDSRRRPYELFRGRTPDDLPALERVAAFDAGKGWAAPFGALEREKRAEAEVEGRPVVVFWSPGAASALDASRIAAGRDVGQSAAFDRRVDGRTLSFEPVKGSDGMFRDRQTGSTWNMAGTAMDGPLAGKRLEPVAHSNPFWFAWAAFKPDTEIWAP
ncbi:MAG: DUF3179 domain-containing protein [Gemmatimonadota bacterium]|nr:DUF3179 domain-containing protein [Gemmatimonadota bacterium]